MDSTGDLTESRSISCPFCGRRSNLSIELPVTEPKTWTHNCPICGKPWKVSLGVRRGLPQLDVTPIIASKPKVAEKATKPTKAVTPTKATKAVTPTKAKKAVTPTKAKKAVKPTKATKPTKAVKKAKKAKPKR